MVLQLAVEMTGKMTPGSTDYPREFEKSASWQHGTDVANALSRKIYGLRELGSMM